MTKKSVNSPYPIFKTAAEMAIISGIGVNKLRELMDQGELDYLPIGNRKLLTIQAVQDYYVRHKVSANAKETNHTA